MQKLPVKDRLRFRALWLAIGWALVLTVVYLSLTPHPISIPVEQGDKVGHVVAYAALMLWFAQIYSPSRRRLLLAVALVALGIGLEFAQLFTETRTFEIADMLADGTGVAIGWLAAPPRTINFLIRVEAIPIWRKI
ncbi:MAG TPA: VanZ family protein [Burkholderiales bacterium]|nr:VanZ family protein [Burkholderiales bacterium]